MAAALLNEGLLLLWGGGEGNDGHRGLDGLLRVRAGASAPFLWSLNY